LIEREDYQIFAVEIKRLNARCKLERKIQFAFKFNLARPFFRGHCPASIFLWRSGKTGMISANTAYAQMRTASF
jgi:hypothetical protein